MPTMVDPVNLDQWPINRNWTAGRVLDQRPVHVRDLQSGEDFPKAAGGAARATAAS
jgi:hypothetical protein